jgi:hypothetical protein
MRLSLHKFIFACVIPLVAAKAQTSVAATSPLPAQLSEKTIFLAVTASPGFLSNKIDAVLYSDLYQSLAKNGYTLVDTPSKAGVAFEASIVSSTQGAFLQVQIIDIKTHTLLWTVETSIKSAVRVSTVESNLNIAAETASATLSALSSGTMPTD